MQYTFQSNAGSQYMDDQVSNIECYKRLGAAIIMTAADDYVYAYRTHNTLNVESIERFFRGHEFVLFSGGNIDPAAVIHALRRKALRR